MSSVGSQNLSQIIREAPSQFKESLNHKVAIGRSLSARAMKQGTRHCDVSSMTMQPKQHKQINNNNGHHKDGINQLNRLEKIMVSRGKVNELSEKNMNKILQSDFYYTDLNEIRSINEFLYIKNNLAVNQHTKRIQSLRDDLKKKQKQIQSIIQKEQNLDQDEYNVAANIDFTSYHKYLIGQKISLSEQKSQRNNLSSQSARPHYKENSEIHYNINKNEFQNQQSNISPFNDQNIMQQQINFQKMQQQSNQTRQNEQVNYTNDAILVISPKTITESAKEDSTYGGEQESFNSPSYQDQMKNINFMHQHDSFKSTAMHSQDNNQIKIIPQYQEGGVDNFMKHQKLSTISERDSELVFQKENYESYRSMMSIDSQNILKAKVIDMNNMYEMFQTRQSNSSFIKSNLSPMDNQNQKSNTMPSRMRHSQFTNEESANDGSEMVSSHYIDEMNSKYNTNNLAPMMSQNVQSSSSNNFNHRADNKNPFGGRSQSAHTSSRQQDKNVQVANLSMAHNIHQQTRRKSSQHSVYLNTQLQYSNPAVDPKLQQIASMPVYKCSFKKRSKLTAQKNSSIKSPTSVKRETNEDKYYSQYTMKEADRFLLNQQIVNGFKQKNNEKQQRDNMLLYQSIKTSKMFNDRIEEALQVKSKEYETKYNQFSTQTNFSQRQSRTSCEARVSKAFLQQGTFNPNDLNNKSMQTNQDINLSPNKSVSNSQSPQATFSQFEQAITELTKNEQNGESKPTIQGQQISINTLLQLGKQEKQKPKNLILLFNDQQEKQESEESDTNHLQTLNTESTEPTIPLQKKQILLGDKSAHTRTYVKLNSRIANSPIKVSNLKAHNAELFNTKQSIQETQQRIQDNLKKIDNNLKKERNYLAKMNMIKRQLVQSKSVETVQRIRSLSQGVSSVNSELQVLSYQPKRAKLSRAEIGRLFKTSEQIQMHKEIGLFNRITYNNFIQKDKKNKILLKNCNYVEFYQ